MLWCAPSKVILIQGKGLGDSELNAFDAALVNAGIGNFNLIQVTSIIPPGASVSWNVSMINDLREGSLLPVVYSKIILSSSGSGSVALALGIPNEKSLPGVIFEASKKDNTDNNLRSTIELMVTQAMGIRKINRYETIVVEASVNVDQGYGAAIVAAVFLE